ncbi:carboxypeptidase-like regulatory domain-containing protein [Pedobacter sp. P26]|uniref:carboxypeptidase-like regulatory domain-containing protein n=1 Tax=Pedobacter sp. P26 TaxID=3423956 RepID=UPI003D6715D7
MGKFINVTTTFKLTNKLMKSNLTLGRSKFLGIIIFLMVPFLSFAQTKVTGTVTDGKNQPLPGASIKQKGTTNGTSSDTKGNFSLTLKEGSSMLTVSIVGYKSKEVSAAGQTSINIELAEDNNSLDEVVAIGYQNIQRKKQLVLYLL